jgi:hypothetical protein
MISPGSTSRSYVAPMMSSAQVSDANTTASPNLPMASGRHPRGSRTASIVSPIVTIKLYAPSTPCNASARRAAGVSAFERARRCTTTSESFVDEKIEP